MATEHTPAMQAVTEELMAALSDFNIEETVESVEDLALAGEIIEEPVIEAAGEVDEDFLNDLDLTVKRQASYEAQTAEEMPDIEETKAENAAGIKVKKARTVTKAPRVAASATPRAPRDLASVPAEFFLLNLSHSTDAAEVEQNKVDVMAKRPGQVKIAEKFDNLFVAISAGRKPSTYVMQAYSALVAAGELTSAQIVATFKAAGLGDGTAQSQTGQIMVLFDTVGIAKRSGQKLTLLPESYVASRLNALTATAAPTPTAA